MISALTRRSFVFASASILACAQTRKPVLSIFDHLLFGVSDLEHGVQWFEQRSGVHAMKGGVHPGQGTRNALVSLGGEHYLEIIAPDPDQSGGERRAQVSTLGEPRLINFAVRTHDMEGTAAALKHAGILTVGPLNGSRLTVSGAMLRWTTLSVTTDLRIGEIDPVPFFIEWASGSTHPSQSAPPGCSIEDLRFEHPRPQELRAIFDAMGIEANVRRADQARIIASIETPRGEIELT
jgi:hypothetical protein